MTPPHPELPNGNTLIYRVGELEQDVRDLGDKLEATNEKMGRKLDRMVWAMVSLALSVTTAAVVFAITTAVSGGP